MIIQQFLRFGETKSIAQEIILQDTRENRERSVVPTTTPKTESEIKKFIERSNMSMTSFMRGFDARHLLGRPLGAATTPPLMTPGGTNSGNGGSGGNSSSSSSTTTRIMSPSGAMGTFSPPVRGPSSNPEVQVSGSSGVLSAVSPVGAGGSPLTRLQGMQPFDYRREHLSPTRSPGTGSEKSLALSSSGHKTPEDLSMSGVAASSSVASSPPAILTTTDATCNTPVALTAQQVTPVQITPTKMDSSDEMSSYTGAISDDSQDGVINYSTKGLSSSSVYADRKIKHLRKSANPMKRHWQPNPTFGSTLISPSGKKRVLCTACNKTFCDKGALKIHYSAVHLKEMHKCTVEGCNMMFSSRRSRNRHSANPNPKLHMPNQKRKMPDGATLVDDKGNPFSLANQMTTTTPSMVMTSMAGCISPTEIKPVVVVPKTEPGLSSPQEQPPMVPPEMGFYMNPAVRMPLLIPSPIKMPKMDGLPPPPSTNIVAAPLFQQHLQQQLPDGFPLEPNMVKREPLLHHGGIGSRSSRKRKSAVPTRCAQLEEMYVMSDDDGSAAPNDPATDENLMPQNLTVPKINRDTGSNDKLEYSNRSLDDKQNECTTSGQCHTDDDKTDNEEDSSSGKVPLSKNDLIQKEKNYEGLSLTTFHEIQAKAIKQMDCISQARLRDVCSDDFPKENDTNNNDEGVGEDDNDNNDTPTRAIEGRTNPNMVEGILEDPNSEPSSPLSVNNASSDLESLDSGGEGSPSSTHTNGHNGLKDYSLEIPMDKDNPRRCTACGKIFPNHFGVKAHYQSVHLSRMHTCTVDGCNAAFPSKRSRDRHSSNLNLHRKLLSTSSPDGESNKPTNKSIHENDYLPRIYSDSGNNGGAFTTGNSYGHYVDTNSGGEEGDSDNNLVINMSTKSTDANMNNSSKDGYNAGSSSPVSGTGHNALTNGDSPSPQEVDSCFNNDFDSQEGSPMEVDDLENPAHNGGSTGMVKCHICRQRFRDNLVLKEHYEKVHPKEMYRCTIGGCDKIFSTRKSRNRHSQNDNLHRHLSPPATNGSPP